MGFFFFFQSSNFKVINSVCAINFVFVQAEAVRNLSCNLLVCRRDLSAVRTKWQDACRCSPGRMRVMELGQTAQWGLNAINSSPEVVVSSVFSKSANLAKSWSKKWNNFYDEKDTWVSTQVITQSWAKMTLWRSSNFLLVNVRLHASLWGLHDKMSQSVLFCLPAYYSFEWANAYRTCKDKNTNMHIHIITKKAFWSKF